jgi:hypothetical protein
MNSVDVGEGVQKDEYGNLIDGTTVPPMTECDLVQECYECPCYKKCCKEAGCEL